MFVPAKTYVNCLYTNILTHFTRREDQQLNSGRLEEEIIRMNHMIDMVDDRCMLLLNESFASTTEKEGSVIAGDIIRALYEAGVDVFMVTHLYAFARNTFEKHPKHALFLSAERREDGTRTYKMVETKPSHTSYGLDLYEELIHPN
jgi:DNA mismatch repair ATPase MutS